MAEDLGRRLLTEVEEVGLDEILQALRIQDGSSAKYFDFPPLDKLLQAVAESRSQTTLKATFAAPPSIVELTSLTPGGGATHLLYHLCTLAVLPANLSGKQACAIIIDAEGTFSVPRLATQIQLVIRQRLAIDADDGPGEESSTIVDGMVLTTLKHIHVFHPQSLAATIATIDALIPYLFDSKKHSSFDRTIGFIALDSASAFYWQDRAEMEDAAFLATTSGLDTKKPPVQPSAYAQLAISLKRACSTFHCPAVITTHYLGAVPPISSHSQLSFRPSLPPPFSALPTIRLALQRLPVRKFPPAISVDDALREAGDRQRAVEEAEFECAINAWGVEERILQRLARVGAGFGFKISAAGVAMVDGM